MRALRTAILAACLVSSACTRSGAGQDGGSGKAATTTTAETADTNTNTAEAKSPPFVTARCRTEKPTPTDPGQIAIGKVALPTMPDPTAGGAPAPQPDTDGVTFYKGGIVIHPDYPAVTISVGSAALAYARIQAEGFTGPLGATAVTYTGRPRIAAEQNWDCWYVGGYNLLGGRTSACVPLDVTIAGDPAVHHVAVSVGTRCPGT